MKDVGLKNSIRRRRLEREQWSMFLVVDYTIAVALVILSLTATKAQKATRTFARQQQAEEQPYPPSGYQPQRPFPLPQRNQYQAPQVTYGAPVPSYGPPPEDPNTTVPTTATTEEVLDVEPLSDNLESKTTSKPSKLQEPSSQRAYFVVLPQRQNYVVIDKSAPVVTVEKSGPTVAIPAETVEEAPGKLIAARIVEPLSVPRLQAIPAPTYHLGYNSVITPFSAFVQIG